MFAHYGDPGVGGISAQRLREMQRNNRSPVTDQTIGKSL